ncbi:MAG: hypothetical protein KatS3mg022_1180 [Armatimonadota bacterium]|nr:MAG: hypothetical protein KatS3mg022_1180 [Armatimonadota bacterium]
MTTQTGHLSVRPGYHGVKVLATVLSSLCILTVAMTLGLGHLYMMAVAIAVVPLVSYTVGKRMLAGLAVQREVADVAWDGQSVSVKIRIHNRSNLPRYFLQAQDTLPEGAQFVEGEGIIPLAIPAGDTQEAEYRVVFSRRGRYLLGPLSLHATDPLGMFFFSHQLREQTEILVLPTPLPLPAMDSTRGALYTTAGVHSAPVRGDSVEFLGIREYVPGDPLRRVDWKHSARYGDLFVRDFERFTQTEVCVVLDRSPVMRQLTNSFEIMVKAASGALHAAYTGGLPFSLVTGVAETDNLPAQWSSEQLYGYLHVLAEVTPQSDFVWLDVVTRAVTDVAPGALLVLITAGVDLRLLPLLDMCARKQIQVVALLPNVPALDRQSGFPDALHDGEFLRLLAAQNAIVIPLHPGVDS